MEEGLNVSYMTLVLICDELVKNVRKEATTTIIITDDRVDTPMLVVFCVLVSQKMALVSRCDCTGSRYMATYQPKFETCMYSSMIDKSSC